MIEYCHIDTGKILMNLNPSFWRVLVYPTFLSFVPVPNCIGTYDEQY